jgi:diacylglycerol O-acyltransferase
MVAGPKMTETIEFSRRMSSADGLFWRLEEDPVLRSTTAAVTILDHSPERSSLTDKLWGAALAIPRLRQRVAPSLLSYASPLWEEDEHFDLDYHLRWIRAPGDRSLHAVFELASAFTMQGFDRSRPLWEFTVVEDLGDGRAAVIQKMHHAVTDGAAGVLLMQRVYDLAPDPRSSGEGDAPSAAGGGGRAHGSRPRAPNGHRPWSLPISAHRLVEIGESALRPLETMRHAWEEVASVAHVFAPTFEPMSPIMRRRSSRYRFATLGVPVAALKAAANASACKLNDAFLAALAGGWHRYHRRHGVEVERLRLTMPINLRDPGVTQTAGNRIAGARFAIPVSTPDARARMRGIHAIVTRERAEPALDYMDAILTTLSYLPASLLTQVVGPMLKNSDFVASCVPGVASPLYIAGARVEALLPFGPTAGSATNATLFSYLDRADVTINADPAAVPDVDVLLECMREGFEEVLACA